MNEEQIEYIEKVKLPEWEGYSWGPACQAIKELVAAIRQDRQRINELERRDGIFSEGD